MRVYGYDPMDSNGKPERWCREGMAVEVEPGRLADTYWGLSGGDRHFLSVRELETAEFLFDTDDFEEVRQYHRGIPPEWAERRARDRQKVTAQHGLQPTYYIRKGSEPSYRVQLRNAREKISNAERKAASAVRDVEWAREELERLKAGHRAKKSVDVVP